MRAKLLAKKWPRAASPSSTKSRKSPTTNTGMVRPSNRPLRQGAVSVAHCSTATGPGRVKDLGRPVGYDNSDVYRKFCNFDTRQAE